MSEGQTINSKGSKGYPILENIIYVHRLFTIISAITWVILSCLDMNAAPYQLQIDDGPPGSLDNLLWALPDGDPIPVNISWTPACHKENVVCLGSYRTRCNVMEQHCN